MMMMMMMMLKFYVVFVRYLVQGIMGGSGSGIEQFDPGSPRVGV